MSVYERINSIEMKMQQLDARMNLPGSYISQAPRAPGQLQSGELRTNEAVTFQGLLQSMTGEERFAPSASKAPGKSQWAGDPHDFDGMIREASQKYNVDESLIRAVVRQESAFNPKAQSYCGAMGLMQLMPETAKDLGVENAWDPYQNIMGGTRYLRQLMDQFDGNLTKTIAAYNAGPGAVQQSGGIPPYPETQNYVSCVLDFYQRYKQGGQSF